MDIAEEGQAVAHDDTLHRFVKASEDYLEYDHDDARWVPTKRAFKRDANGISAYSARVLESGGLTPSDVARDQQDAVFGMAMTRVTGCGLKAVHEPLLPASRVVDPAHSLIQGKLNMKPSSTERDELRAAAIHSSGLLPPPPARFVSG